MNEPEAFQLLTLASARDNRTVSQSVAAVWAEDLRDVPLDVAVEALKLHYREFPDVWLKPGHVLAGVRRLRDRWARDARIQKQFARLALPAQQITLDRAEFDRLTNEAAAAHRAAKALSP